jgi:hypothetical protein
MVHIISYGGGVNSTAMTLLLLEHQEPVDYILFADTGEEKPETYQFIEVFGRYLKDKYSLSITVVRRMVDGKPQTLSEYCKQHVILPSFNWRFCTDRFKVQPIRKFLRTVFGESRENSFAQYIGFDAGEWERAKQPRWEDTTNIYPLIENDIHRIDCECIIRRHELPIPPKSSCYFCPFAKPKELAELANKHPNLITEMKELEEYVNNPTISKRKKPFTFFNQYTIQQWIDIGCGKLKAEKLQLWLFDARKPCACLD